MIFESTSNQKLKYAKARAKQSEFSVPRSEQPAFPLDPSDLHYSAIQALSAYTRARLSSDDGRAHLTDLEKTASFYDASANDAVYGEFRDGYWQLAAATYFLLGNYGSAKVACQKIDDRSYYGDNAAAFISLVDYLLIPGFTKPEKFPLLAEYLEGADVSVESVEDEALSFGSWDSPEDHLFGKIIIVAVSDTLNICCRKLLPELSATKLTSWISYLRSRNAGKILWQAQQAIGQSGVFAGANSFVQLPTGSGKTRSIEILIRSRFYSGGCNLVVVVAPLRALCSEIARDLKEGLADIAEVRRSSEVFELDSWLSELSMGLEVLVFTPEKFSFILRHNEELLKRIDVFVFDEAHLIDDPSRGPGYELMLAELKTKRSDAQFVFLSAVIANPDKIAEWALGDGSLVVSNSGIQVTEKSIGVIGSRSSCMPFGTKVSFGNDADIFANEYFAFVDLEVQELSLGSRERKVRLFPDIDTDTKSVLSQDVAVCYANRLLSNGPSAIYIPRKSLILPFYKRFSGYLERGCDLGNLALSVSDDVKAKFNRLIELHYGTDCELCVGLKMGVLPHYGDLQGSIRQSVEDAMQRGQVSCIVCTSTLAEGVNLPIKYLIVTDVKAGLSNPKTRDFQNLIGRTARSGRYSEGSVIIADSKANNVKNKAGYRRLTSRSNIESCESAILELLADCANPDDPASGYVSGSQIVNFILEYLDNGNLVQILGDAFSKAFRCKPLQGLRLAEVRVKPLEAIECYLANELTSGSSEMDVMEICVTTYAYSCATDDEQEYLIKLFEAIYEKLKDKNVLLCSKTQLGIRKTSQLEEWVNGEAFAAFLRSDFEDLRPLVEGYFEVEGDFGCAVDSEQLSCLVDCWLGGMNIGEALDVLNARFTFPARKAPSVRTIEGVFSGQIKYALSHFVSCVIDSMELSSNPQCAESVEKMKAVQRSLKYGTKDPCSMIICEELFDDRFVAHEISKQFEGVIPSNAYELRRCLESNREAIDRVLGAFPLFFASAFDEWLR